MTHKLAAIVLPIVIACAADAPPPEMPAKIFDFSGSGLAELVPMQAPKRGASIKTMLRYGIRQAQPALLGCYDAYGRDARGTIALSLRLSGTMVEWVDVGVSLDGAIDERLTDCIRDTAMTIEFPPMPELGDAQVNYPFTVGA